MKANLLLKPIVNGLIEMSHALLFLVKSVNHQWVTLRTLLNVGVNSGIFVEDVATGEPGEHGSGPFDCASIFTSAESVAHGAAVGTGWPYLHDC